MLSLVLFFEPWKFYFIFILPIESLIVAIFTLYWIVKRSIAETVPDKAFVHTGNAKFGTISAPEQVYFSPFVKDVIPAMQWSTKSCSCSHCTGSVSATLRFTIPYSVNIAFISLGNPDYLLLKRYGVLTCFMSKRS